MEEKTTPPEQRIRGPAVSKRARYITALGITVTVAAMFLCNYTVALTVQVNEQTVAKVTSKEVLDTALETAKTEISDILGYEYNLEDKISVNSTIISSKEASDDAHALEENIYESIDEIGQQYVIKVDGQEVGSVSSLEELENGLERQLESSTDENTVSAEFTADIDYEYKYAPTESSLEDEALTEVLSTVPIETVEEITYTVETPYRIEYLLSEALYEDEWQLSQEGQRGKTQVTARVTYLDGEEQAREFLSETVISEPVTEIIYVGTLDSSSAIITGSFMWPADGKISSQFGYRNVSVGSSDHKGIDISCSADSPIYAADGGYVIFADWSGGYGKLVQVQHQDGVVTYYAHCNSIEVAVGDVVAKGEEIAKVGTTGTSTGYHVHFEIRIDDTPVNPLDYLPDNSSG